MINYNHIDYDESGSINIEFIDLDKMNKKLSKHSYILDNRIDLSNLYKSIRFNSDKTIDNGIYNVILFNGNFNINIDCEIINNKIIFDNNIYLQDKKFIILLKHNFADLFICFMEK